MLNLYKNVEEADPATTVDQVLDAWEDVAASRSSLEWSEERFVLAFYGWLYTTHRWVTEELAEEALDRAYRLHRINKVIDAIT